MLQVESLSQICRRQIHCPPRLLEPAAVVNAIIHSLSRLRISSDWLNLLLNHLERIVAVHEVRCKRAIANLLKGHLLTTPHDKLRVKAPTDVGLSIQRQLLVESLA
jgi:hypothetical protein